MGANGSSSSAGPKSRSQFFGPATPGNHLEPKPISYSNMIRRSTNCPSCHDMGGVLISSPDRMVLEIHDDVWEYRYVMVLKRRYDTIHMDDLANPRGVFSIRSLFTVYEELKTRSHCVKTPDRIACFVVLTNANFGRDVFEQCLLNVSHSGEAFLGRHDPPGTSTRCYAFRYFPDDWQATIKANQRDIEEFRHNLIVAVCRPDVAPGGCRLFIDCDNDYEELFHAENGCLEILTNDDLYDDVFISDDKGDEARRASLECDETSDAEDECDGRQDICDECHDYDIPCDEVENHRDVTSDGILCCNCDDVDNPYDECDDGDNPYDECDESWNPYDECDESNNPYDECDEVQNSRDDVDKMWNVKEESDIGDENESKQECYVRYTSFKSLVAISEKPKMAPISAQYSSKYSATSSQDCRDTLLNLVDTKMSGLFRDDPTSPLNSPDFFRDVEPLVLDHHYVVVASDQAPLSCLKVIQALLYGGCGDRIIFDPRSLLQYRDWLDVVLASDTEIALVVYWHGDERSSAEEYLCGLPDKATNPRQKIVVVCQKGDEPLTKGWTSIADDWNAKELSHATHRRFFDTCIDFQGRKTTVADFFRDVDDSEIPSGWLLSRIVSHGRLEIGAADLEIDIVDRRYVHRNFRWSLGCFTKGCLPSVPVSEVLILKRRSSQSATIGVVRRGRLYAVGSDDKWKGNQRKNVHVMEWNGSCFVARDLNENHIQDECDLITYDIKVVVVSGAPGAGKTTAVVHMLRDLKTRDPGTWIVRLNLAEVGPELRALSAKPDFGADDALDLLCLASNDERTLLKSKLTTVVAFVDGFDEVTPAHGAVVLRMLALLKGLRLRGLWVTTRPQWTRILESTLACGSYAILPLDPRVLMLSHDAVDFVARAIVSPALRVATRVIGEPLLASMLAEVAEEPECDETLDVVALYARFLKRRGYATNKNYHLRLALDAILPDEAATLLPLTDLNKCDEDHIAFRHRTFAEFFVAKFVASRSQDTAVIAALRGRYLDENGDVLRLFLDHMLAATSPLHKAVLHGDIRSLAMARRQGIDMSQIRDTLGRTPLHLAAAYPDDDTISPLVIWMSDVIHQPDQLDLSPLAYAYTTLASSGGAYEMLVTACDQHDKAFKEALCATLAAAEQRRGGAEAQALCELVRNRFPERIGQLRKCLYCAHFRRWHQLNCTETQESTSIKHVVERMLEFFKATLATERYWGELLKAHNVLVARLKGGRHRWPSQMEYNKWLARVISEHDVGALFRLRRFFRADGWG